MTFSESAGLDEARVRQYRFDDLVRCSVEDGADAHACREIGRHDRFERTFRAGRVHALGAPAVVGALHSRLDMGAASRSTKVAGRKPLRLHPADAAARGLSTGDIALVRSAQGSLLAGVVVTDAPLTGSGSPEFAGGREPTAPHWRG